MPDYASPEQLRGDAPAPSTDVYSLGVLLFELLCGSHPHRRPSDTRWNLWRRILHEPAARPSEAVLQRDELAAEERALRARVLRGPLDDIVLTALQKEPRLRYASAGTLAADVRRHLAGRRVRASERRVYVVA